MPKTDKPQKPVKNGVVDFSEDEAVESPQPRRKKISVGVPIHPPEGEITNMLVVNKRVAEVKGDYRDVIMYTEYFNTHL